jgi:multiple sugar transport system permease protein
MNKLSTGSTITLTKGQVRFKQPRRSIRWAEQATAYLFLLPAIVLFGLFAWFPIINSVLMSFQNVKLGGESTWVGLDNYSRMFSDPLFLQTWGNSLQFALISIIMGFFVPIAVAIFVNELRRFQWFFRLAYFLPNLIPVVIYVLVWRLIYAPEGGFLNSFLKFFGIGPQLWLQNPDIVKPAIVVVLTWANFGGTMLIYLAALQDLAPDLYEAAEIDGASPLGRIRYITLPYLVSTMKLLLIVQVIAVAQLFAEPFLLTSGGPANSSLTPPLAIYQKAFANNDFGLASAWSVMIVCFLGGFSLIFMRLTQAGNSANSD